MTRILMLSAAVLLTSLSVSRADDKPGALPPPRVVEEVVPPPVVVLPYVRVSQYAVWDYYAVDRNGYFKPRVIATPYGAFYPLTGKPYPWTTTNPRNFMPYASD